MPTIAQGTLIMSPVEQVSQLEQRAPWMEPASYPRSPARRLADEPERMQGKKSSVKINVFSEQLSDRLLQECAEIWVACFTGPPRFESWTKESAEEELKKYLEQNGDFILAMPSDEQVAAFAVGLPVARHYGGTDLIAAGAHPQSYYFVALGTRPEYRRQGLGAALHKRREEEGVKRGYSVMTVRVRSDNADNLRLLERAGFSETGRYQASIGQSIAERLIMTKFVSRGVTDN